MDIMNEKESYHVNSYSVNIIISVCEFKYRIIKLKGRIRSHLKTEKTTHQNVREVIS